MIETITYPKETKAKKEHSCNFCLDKIKVDEIYIKSTYVFDGQIYDWKTFKDYPHFQKTYGLSWQQLKAHVDIGMTVMDSNVVYPKI